MDICSLLTYRKGDFTVKNLFTDGAIGIFLPNRTRLELTKQGSVISLHCDLGLMSSDVDFIKVCEIDISESGYREAVKMDDIFTSRARFFDNSFHIGKFVRSYISGNQRAIGVFGEDWLDQVYIHLTPNFGLERKKEDINNLEFSVIRARYMDDELLVVPKLTMVGSLKLKGEMPHYFLFIEWDDGRYLSYEKNFFFNNQLFHKGNS